MSKKTSQQKFDVIWKKKMDQKGLALLNNFGEAQLPISSIGYIESKVKESIEKSFEKNPINFSDEFTNSLIEAMKAHLPFILKGAFRTAKIENDKEVKASEAETKDRAIKAKSVVDAFLYQGFDEEIVFDNEYLLKSALRAKLDMILRELIQQNINTLMTQLSISVAGLQREALEKLWGKDEYNVTLLDVLAVRANKTEE